MNFSADLQNLAAIRQYIHDRSSELGAPPRMVEDLLLAVDEAATNIIIHGYGREKTRPHHSGVHRDEGSVINIDLSLHDGAIVVVLRDDAPPFDPTELPPPDVSLPLEQRPIGGLGVFLIRHSVDEFHHRVLEGGGNELILIKRIPIAG